MRRRRTTLLGHLNNFPPMATSTRRHVIQQEGCYDDIAEWEQEEITQVEEPQTMETLVYGPPKAPGAAGVVPMWAQNVNDILWWYLEPR